jgi:flagellar motor protein MotB
MRPIAWTRWLRLAVLVFLAGCADSSMVLKGNLDAIQKEQLAMARRNQELQNRADALDRDNQELETLLAQSRQQVSVAEDRAGILRQQLSDTASQLAQLRDAKEASDEKARTLDEKARTLTASMQRRGSVTITPNNSFRETLPAIHLPGIEARRDGDVIRIELPESRLFKPGTADFLPDAKSLIAAVAEEVARTYPRQAIGVEGHTDRNPAGSDAGGYNMQLSVSWAFAVHNALIAQGRLRPEQLTVAGHGANYPVVSDGPPGGRQRNRRVELVIYPERVP